MRCSSPVTLKDPARVAASRALVVPCGYCGACRHNRRVEWSFRIAEELSVSSSACFVTLTYSDDNIPFGDGEPTLCKRDYQLFRMRLVKRQYDLDKSVKIRYYAVGEYGSRTRRPHYHAILFNVLPSIRESLPAIWGLGHVHIGDVNEKSIHYITKYHVNFRKQGKSVSPVREDEFALMSLKPGIGASYLDRAAKWHTDHGNVYVMNNGFAQRMPRYYKNKIFSDDERERLSNEALASQDEMYWKEYERLLALAVRNPDAYMKESAKHYSDLVLDKGKRSDVL